MIALPAAGRTVALVVAVDAFLDRFRDDPATRATYTETLRRLRETAGDQLPLAVLTQEIYEQTMARWNQGAANTWNKHLSALTSFTAYCRRQDWLTADPGRRLERRKVTRTRDKAIPRARLERLFTDDRNPLRERVPWRRLCETCARAEEILGPGVPDPDMEFRRALVTEKGGDRAYVHGETPLPDQGLPQFGRQRRAALAVEPDVAQDVPGRSLRNHPPTDGILAQRAHGAEVTGVDHGGKLDRLRVLGFDHVLDSRREGITGGGRTYDLVLDVRPGRSPFDYLRTPNPGGRYVTVGGTLPRLAQTWALGPWIRLRAGKSTRVVILKANKDMTQVNELFESGVLRPVITARSRCTRRGTPCTTTSRATSSGRSCWPYLVRTDRARLPVAARLGSWAGLGPLLASAASARPRRYCRVRFPAAVLSWFAASCHCTVS